MRSRHFLTVFLVVFFLLLAPLAVIAQDQAQPEDTVHEQGEKTDDAPDPDAENTEPAGEQQQGSLLIPVPGGEPDVENDKAGSTEETGKAHIYIIKQGDTLWDISHAFLKDPFLWPFLWKANPYIENADLIYPGNNLVIPSLTGPVERALQATPSGQEEQPQPPEKNYAQPASADVLAKRPPLQTSPTGTQEEQPRENRLILPDEEPVPIMDRYSMLNAGFVNQLESDDMIVASKEEKTILGYDDIVYATVRSKDAAVGDKFIMYTPLNKVKHPVTGRNFGRLIKVLGILELTQKGTADTFAARITLSFDAAAKGTLLTPYQEPILIYNNPEGAKAKDISGHILEVMDTRTINAQTDIVYLDKGSADGVDAGDRFLVYARTKKKNFPLSPIGEAQVFLVKEHTSTAIVRKSTNTLAKGDKIEYKK